MRLWSLIPVALSLASVACGPLGPIPGGRLSGSVAASPVDWTFADVHREVQLETRPDDPYSVNVWGVGLGNRFYLAAGEGGETTWARHIEADPRVRLRLGETVYELRAVHVESVAERDRFLEAVKQKYDWDPEPEQREKAWLFRLEPR